MYISVIIPTFNRAWLLKKCLNSLAKQTHRRYEVIVVDDSSKDLTESVVKNAMKGNRRVKYFRQQKNQGPGKARNVGIKKSRGEIIAFMDDDCIASEDWLKNISTEFRKNKDIAGVEGRTVPDRKVGAFSHYIKNATGGHYLTCNMAYRKNVIKKIMFDERYKMANREDSDLAFSVLDGGGKITFSKDVLVKHIVFRSSFMSKMRRKKAFMYDMLLWKKHPKLYRKIIRFPFERFTPLYILFSLLALWNLVFFVALILISLYEMKYRKWFFNFSDFVKFFVLQVVGSFVLVVYVVYGLLKF